MSTTSIPGGGDHNVNVYGDGSVVLGNGNNVVTVGGTANVLVGSGNNNVQIGGSATISAGSGNNQIAVQGSGQISVGGGNDTIALIGSGNIVETGASGHDTISLGSLNNSIYVQGTAYLQGSATVQSGHFQSHFSSHTNGVASGSLGGATIVGGELISNHSQGIMEEFAVLGTATILGGSTGMILGGGTGSAVLTGGSGHDTFIGGSGHDTMTGVGSNNVFEFVASPQGGTTVITNFVSGDQLNVEGHTLSYLLSSGEITTQNGNTLITVDGGRTTIELQGVVENGANQQGGSAYPHGPGHMHEPVNEIRHSFGLHETGKF